MSFPVCRGKSSCYCLRHGAESCSSRAREPFELRSLMNFTGHKYMYHVTLGSNVTNYIPLWNENLAHVNRCNFHFLPPPPFPAHAHHKEKYGWLVRLVITMTSTTSSHTHKACNKHIHAHSDSTIEHKT